MARQTDTVRGAPAKVTREEWLHRARDTLVARGVGEVKVLTLARDLGVARSSFYWYFENRADLLAALLAEWELRNTRSILAKCERPAETIAEAACHFFKCFIDPALFDQGLDFAVREWARRDTDVRAKIDAADAARIEAVTAMFARHGYAAAEADARARILYFMQLGYHALEVREPMELRMSRLAPYIQGFTGTAPDPGLVAQFAKRARALVRG